MRIADQHGERGAPDPLAHLPHEIRRAIEITPAAGPANESWTSPPLGGVPGDPAALRSSSIAPTARLSSSMSGCQRPTSNTTEGSLRSRLLRRRRRALAERDRQTRLPQLAAAVTRLARWRADEIRRVADLPQNNGYGPPDHHNRRVPRYVATIEWRRQRLAEPLPLAAEAVALRRETPTGQHDLQEAVKLYADLAAGAGRRGDAGDDNASGAVH